MTSALPSPVVPASAPAFRQETADVLARLRSALIDLMDAHPYGACPGGVRKSRDVQKLFGVDAKLSWQIFRIISSADPLQLSVHVPSAAPMRKLLEAARKRGASEQRVEAAASAFEAFQRHVETHAGDRTSFDSMMSGVTDSDVVAQNDVAHRRSIFEGHRHVWGVQIDTYIRGVILHPSDRPGLFDYGNVRMKLGLRRLRADAPVVVDRMKLVPPDGEVDVFERDMLDPAAARRFGAPILPQFCSSPLPQLKMTRDNDGRTTTELAGDTVGRLGSADVAFGQVHRWAPLSPRPGNRLGFSGSVTFSTPTRLAILDVLVHRPTFGPLEYELSLWGHANDIRKAASEQDLPRLPCRERIVYLGGGAAAARTPDVPQYVDLLWLCCQKMGWDLDQMDVYRVTIDYPLMDTAVMTDFCIPASETWPRPEPPIT